MWFFFFFKQKTAYEMRISDWSSDVCSSDLEWRSQSNGYGLTETFTLCTWAEPEEQDGEFRVTHGRALPGIDLRIVDSDTGEPLPTGELGEIAVKGVTFMLGYHKVDDEEYLDRDRKSTRLNSSH